MLKIIGPKGHRFHQSSIEAFLDLLNVYQDFELSRRDEKRLLFLSAEDNGHGVYGGAVLYPQKVWGLPEEDVSHDRYEDTFCGAFATFRPLIQEFWIARICFCLEANFSPEALWKEWPFVRIFTKKCMGFSCLWKVAEKGIPSFQAYVLLEQLIRLCIRLALYAYKAI